MGDSWCSRHDSQAPTVIEIEGTCDYTLRPCWNYRPACPHYEVAPRNGFFVSGDENTTTAEFLAKLDYEMEKLSECQERGHEPGDIAAQWAEVVGRKFRPTFSSPIDHFTIRGYDAERDFVLTTAHPKEGEPFDDEIEARYLIGAFETGEYEALPIVEPVTLPFINYRTISAPKPRRVCYDGPSCNRCQHRFGSTSNSKWCQEHYKQERCYRFKLEK